MSGDPPLPADPGGHERSRGEPDPSDIELSALASQVPDDARELDDDRRALLLELRQRAVEVAARARPAPAGSGRAAELGRRVLRRIGVTGALLIGVLLVVGLAGSLVSVFAPRGVVPLERLPLATDVLVEPGQVGGLLPEADVAIGPRQGEVRAIRPAVLLLIPPSCSQCDAVVANVVTQARQYTLATVLVGTLAQAEQLRVLDQDGGGGAVQLIDDDAVLLSAYALSSTEPTMVLVHADGIVGGVLTPEAETRYESAFVQLPRAGAGA